jgi:hypothetical protein
MENIVFALIFTDILSTTYLAYALFKVISKEEKESGLAKPHNSCDCDPCGLDENLDRLLEEHILPSDAETTTRSALKPGGKKRGRPRKNVRKLETL